MLNILAFYLFLSSIILWFWIKYLITFLEEKQLINSIYIYSGFLAIILGFLLISYIPSSLIYNNDVFNVLIYAVMVILWYIFIKKHETPSKDKKELIISDFLLTTFWILIYISYIITLIMFNFAFYENMNLWLMLIISLINGLFMSLFFLFSENKDKYNLVSLWISILIWWINILVLYNSNSSSYFIPNISYIIQSFLWFISLFYIIYLLITKELITKTFLGIFLLSIIIWKLII